MKIDKAVNIGTISTACFHLVCCGLPTMAAIAGIISPVGGIFSPLLMNILLCIAGLATAASWIFYFRGCACHKKLLIISTIVFAAALVTHFIPMSTGEEAILCH